MALHAAVGSLTTDPLSGMEMTGKDERCPRLSFPESVQFQLAEVCNFRLAEVCNFRLELTPRSGAYNMRRAINLVRIPALIAVAAR